MAYQETDQRFRAEPTVVSGSYATTSTTSTTATTVTGSTVTYRPGEVNPGMLLRYKGAGTVTVGGSAAAHTLILDINGTTVQTLTADDNSEVDWCFEFNLLFTGPKTQRCWGVLLKDTADPEVEYDAAAVSTGDVEVKVKLVVTAGDSGDTITVNMFTIEQLQL